VYGIDAGAGIVYALNPYGRVLWRTTLSPDIFTAKIAVGRGDRVYVGHGSTIGAYDAGGRTEWEVTDTSPIAGLALRSDGVLIALSQDSVRAINRDGTLLWERRLALAAGIGESSVIVDAAGTTYLGQSNGDVEVLSPGGDLLSSLRVAPGGVRIAIDEKGRLILSGGDGLLSVYSE
jgi:hypothetical protein